MTVTQKGTGLSRSSYGFHRHRRTASMAADSRRGTDLSTFTREGTPWRWRRCLPRAHEKRRHRFELRKVPIDPYQRNDDEGCERAYVNGERDPEKEALASFRAQIAVAGQVLQELIFFHVSTVPRAGESRANRW